MEWFVSTVPVPMTVEFGMRNVLALLLGCFVAIAPVLLAVRAALALETAKPSSLRSRALECDQDLRRAHLGVSGQV